MPIAAGVLLIITAMFNLFASSSYFANGGIAFFGAKASTELLPQSGVEESNGNATAADKDTQVKAQESGASFAWVVMGVFLLISVGVLVAGAICLFINQKPSFIFLAGIMTILAEVIGVFVVGFSPIHLVGLAGGALAIYCANEMRKGLNPV